LYYNNPKHLIDEKCNEDFFLPKQVEETSKRLVEGVWVEG